MKKEEIAYNKGYRISNDGEIINPKGNIIKGSIGTFGTVQYKKFVIRDFNNKVIRIEVHRLMGYQKFGDLIYNKYNQIRHLNCNSLDNSYNNIQIGTSFENNMDKPKDVRLKASNIASLSSSKYDKELVYKIREDRNNGLTYKELMEKYNISSKGTISFLINKRTLFEV